MSSRTPFSPTIALVTEAREAEVRLATALEPLQLSLRKLGILGLVVGSAGVSPTALARAVPDSEALVRTLVAAGYLRSGGRPAQVTATDAGIRARTEATSRVARLDVELFGDRSGLAAALADLQPQPGAPQD